MYALTIYGQPISKPHPHRVTCYIEALERGMVVRSGAINERFTRTPPGRSRAARRRPETPADMDGLPVTAHAALLARVRLALMARGHAVVIEYV